MTWDVDPFVFHGGGLPAGGLRWYSLCFLAALVGGAGLFAWQLRRGGRPASEGWDFLVLGTAGVLVGTRVAHLAFYEPVRWLKDPLVFFRFWEGGLASHGAVVGLAAALALFCRARRMPYAEACDRLSWASAAGAGWIRLGNLFNSEITGTVTSLPWGVRFVQAEGALAPPRHPSQVYELLWALVVLGLLTWVDRALGGERRPRGAVAAVLLLSLFSGRALLELTKPAPWTGLWLSLPFVAVGAVWLVVVLRRRRHARG